MSLSTLPIVLLLVCTAYTASFDVCGKTDGITASGVKATAGRTVACDSLPFGTKVIINGRTYVVEDRFGGGHKNRIDIFMNSKKEALQYGRRKEYVTILPKEE